MRSNRKINVSLIRQLSSVYGSLFCRTGAGLAYEGVDDKYLFQCLPLLAAVAADVCADDWACVWSRGMGAFYWKYHVAADCRAAAGRKVWLVQYSVCHPRNGAGDRDCKLYLFPACAAARRKRRGVRFYPAVTFYQREGGKHTDYPGACGGALYRRTGLQRRFCGRQCIPADPHCRRMRGSRARVCDA